MRLVMWLLCALRVSVGAITVETPQNTLDAARGRSVTLPCTYHTSVPDRRGIIQWDKLLWSHSERVVTWEFETRQYTYGDLYKNRVNVSSDAEQSDASITIGQLTMDDNGTYECSVLLMSDLDGTSKSRIRLLVLGTCLLGQQDGRGSCLLPPSKPDCAIEGETVIGNNIQLTCSSKEGSPAPQYSWKSYNALNQERPLASPVTGQTFSLKNISTDMSGYYICFSSNKVETTSCNITLAVRLPSMNVALYAGIAGGVAAAFIILGIIIYCCCCRGKGTDEDKEDTRPNREDYRQPPEQLREFSREQEEEDSYRQEDERHSGHESPDHPGQ